MRKILLSLFFLGWLLPVNALPVSKNSDTFLETDSAGYRSYRLDEVTVISNPKAYAKLFEFPGSITYLSERNIEELNLRSVKDISTVAPNLFIPDYGSKLISSAYIRGIGSRINSPAVGLNVNNIPYLDKSAFDFDFLEIDRIEILRGPQGTLYGRNTMAGLINIYTKSPFDYQGTKIMLGGGNYSAMGMSAFTSRKINGKMAFSLGARYRSNDGYFTNKYNDKSSGDTKVGGAQFQFQWRANKRCKLAVNFDFESSDQKGYPYNFYDKETGKWGDINYNDESSYRRDVITGGVLAQYIHDRFMFSSTTSYQFLDDDLHFDQDFTPLSIFTLRQKQRAHTVTQELVIKATPEKRWQWLAGVFGSYQGQKTDGPVDFRNDGIRLLIADQTNKQLATLKDKFPAMPVMKVDVNNSDLYIDGIYRTPSYGFAAFGQFTANDLFTKGLSVTAGLRLDYEHLEITHHTYATEDLSGHITGTKNIMGNDIELFRIPFVLPLGLEGAESMNTVELLPKFEIKYTFAKSAFIYASAARGYRSGGYNFQMFSNLIQAQIRTDMMKTLMDNMPGMGGNMPSMGGSSEPLSVNDVISYKPEHSWNYEIGGRARMLDNKLTADAALFYIDCRDQQISAVSGYGRVTRNSGRTASYGLEASLQATPVKSVLLTAGYGYTHATFKKYHDGASDYTGNYVPFAPMHTLSVTGAYTLNINRNTSLTFDAQYLGRGKIYWTERNDVSQGFYGLLNAGITLANRNAEIRLWSKNLLDTRYQSFYFETMNAENLAVDNSFMQRGRPLTFGMDVTVKF
ncbi:MAG: TonB-dependent receptor [Barnesiella sp.]